MIVLCFVLREGREGREEGGGVSPLQTVPSYVKSLLLSADALHRGGRERRERVAESDDDVMMDDVMLERYK